jgi:hypothetical protein
MKADDASLGVVVSARSYKAVSNVEKLITEQQLYHTSFLFRRSRLLYYTRATTMHDDAREDMMPNAKTPQYDGGSPYP